MNFIKETNQIYLQDEHNNMIAEITFPHVRDNIVDVNHTFVDSSLRGQGVAGKLMEELVTLLQETNQKAILTCSYAIKWFHDHPEYHESLE